MKTIVRLLNIICLLAVVALVSCGEPEPSAKELFLKKLYKKWGLSSTGVKLNEQLVNGVFDNFTVTFAKGLTYTTTDGQDPVWKASGIFSLEKSGSQPGFLIARDDGVQITVSEITETKLVLKFAYTKKGSRASSVSGGYVFDLIPK